MSVRIETLQTQARTKDQGKGDWMPVSQAVTKDVAAFNNLFASMGATGKLDTHVGQSAINLPWGTQTVEYGGSAEIGHVRASGLRMDASGEKPEVTLKLRDTDINLTNGHARLLFDQEGNEHGAEFIPFAKDASPRLITITSRTFVQEKDKIDKETGELVKKSKPDETIVNITERRVVAHEKPLSDGDQGIVWMSWMAT